MENPSSNTPQLLTNLKRWFLCLFEPVFAFVSGSDHNSKLESKVFCLVNFVNAISNIGGAFVLVYDQQYTNAVINCVIAAVFVFNWFVAPRYLSYKYLYWPMVISIIVFLVLSWNLDNGSRGGSHYYWLLTVVVVAVTSPSYTQLVLAEILIMAITYLMFWFEIAAPEIFPFDLVQRNSFDVANNYVFVQFLILAFTVFLIYNLQKERCKSEEILDNLLPKSISKELKEKAFVRPRQYPSASVLFVDFVGFSALAPKVNPNLLIQKLNEYFSEFDKIMARHNLEKIKTLGDGYMAAAGVPEPNSTHPFDCLRAAIDIVQFIRREKIKSLKTHEFYFDVRIGINTGPLMAGVIGLAKMSYDIWGETVNLASRIESGGQTGYINVSQSTFEEVRDVYEFSSLGKINAKNIGEVEVYCLHGIKKQGNL